MDARQFHKLCSAYYAGSAQRRRQTLASRGGGKTVLGAVMASVEPETPKALSRTLACVASHNTNFRWGMRRGYPLPSRLEGLGERRKLPKWGPGQNPGEKRFYCFLSVSERLSLLRLLKINVVHSRPLVETRSSAEEPRDASCQLKSCQLPRNSAETTCTTSPEQMENMKLEGYGVGRCVISMCTQP